MNRYVKFLMGVALCTGIYTSFVSNSKAFATGAVLRDPDVFPPTGTVEFEGGTPIDGVFYTSQRDIILKITASDNKTDTDKLLMIVSGEQLTDAEIIDEDNKFWEPYKARKEYKLSDENNGLNRIYLYLKDEAGNISNSLLISSPDRYTVSYEGEGEDLPESKKTELGIVFPVSTAAPTNGNKFFLGWSATKGGSVQWGRDGIIEPKYIKGNTTLYAVWSDTPPKLSDMVEIGDYVDYPVDCEKTMYGDYVSTVGWRVLDIEGDTVKLVSAGIPLAYWNRGETSSFAAITDFTDKFLETRWAGNIFTGSNTSLGSTFSNEYTAGVRALLKSDLDKLTGTELTLGTDIRKYGSLIYNGGPYYLGETISSWYIWCINERTDMQSTSGRHGIYLGYGMVCNNENGVHSGFGSITPDYVYQSGATNQMCGVRVVVTLNAGLTTEGRTDDGMWLLEPRVSDLTTLGLEIGDVIEYEADVTKTNASGEKLTWRVLDIDEETNTVEITRQGGKWTEDEFVSLTGIEGIISAVDTLNQACEDLYSKGNITARNMTIEDVEKLLGEDNTSTAESQFSSGTFYIIKGQEDVNENVITGGTQVDKGDYIEVTASEAKPVTAKITHSAYTPTGIASDILGGTGKNYGGGKYDSGWLASVCTGSNYPNLGYYGRFANSSSVNAYSLYRSDGTAVRHTFGLRPVVSLHPRMFNLEASADGVWVLK